MKPLHVKSTVPTPLASLAHRAIAPLMLFVACVFSDTACSTPADPGDSTGKVISAATASNPFANPLLNDAALAAACPGPSDNSHLPAASKVQDTPNVGTIPGTFAVGQAGQATYTMPLDVPPGRHGMQPSLGIRYDSTGGDGMLGLGFSLSGFSAITRCPKTLARDGIIQDVRYQGTDDFCLDGERLVVISESAETTEYRTFPDTFAKIVAHHPAIKTAVYDSTTGPLFWTEFTKSGLQIQFGGGSVEEASSTKSGTAFALGGAVRSWWITRVADRRGNTVEYDYQRDATITTGGGSYTTEIVPSQIRYTGTTAAPNAPTRNSVKLTYDTKDPADNRTLFSGGMAQTTSRRLSRVQMLTSGNTVVHEYVLTYDLGTNSKRTLLSQVQDCAGAAPIACKPATRFTWKTQEQAGFDVSASMTRPSTTGMIGVLDLNGDGLQDVLTSNLVPSKLNPSHGEVVNETNFFQANLNTGTSLDNASAPLQWDFPFVVPDDDAFTGPFPEVGTPIDYDQDGRADLFLSDVNNRYSNFQVLLTKQSGPGNSPPTFETVDTHIANGPGPQGNPISNTFHGFRTHLADVTGDGVPDLILCSLTPPAAGDPFEISSTAWEIHPWAPGGFQAAANPIDPLAGYPCDAPFYTADLNADGKVDLVYSSDIRGAGSLADPGVVIAPGTHYVVLGLQSVIRRSLQWESWPTSLPVRPFDRLLFTDVNGDGLVDAIQSGNDDSQLHVFINVGGIFASGTGFGVDHLGTSPIPGIPSGQFLDLAQPIDFNADGRQDLLIPMNETLEGLTHWFILQSTGRIDGDGIFMPIELPFVHAPPSGDKSILVDPFGARVADFNGDGALDALVSLSSPPQSIFTEFEPKTLTMLSGRARRDTLFEIRDGLNASGAPEPSPPPTVRIFDAPLLDADITHGTPFTEEHTYHKQSDPNNDCTYPRTCVVGMQRVVSAYQIDTGGSLQTFRAFYRDGRFDHLTGGWLGFAKRFIVEDTPIGTPSVGTMDIYDNITKNPTFRVYPFVGIARSQWSWNPPPDSPTALMDLTYSDGTLEPFPTNDGRTFFVRTTQRVDRRAQTTAARDLDPTLSLVTSGDAGDVTKAISTTTRTYPPASIDDFGNAKAEQVTTDGVALFYSVSRTFFPPDKDKWLVSQLETQTESSGTSVFLRQARILSRTYDDAGDVQTETRTDNLNPRLSTFFLETRFVRDHFGNVIATKTDDGRFGDVRDACTSYDADGYFPHASVDPVGHTTFMEYDPAYGVPLAAQDANGLVAQWLYDGFGRRTEELRPDGTSTKFALTGPQNGAAMSVTSTTLGGAHDTTDYDRRGRPFRSFSEAPCAAPCTTPPPRIVQTQQRDFLGNINARSVPTSETTPPASVLFDRYVYDSAGRVVSHTTPWGATTTYAYIGNTVTVTDPLAHTTVLTIDPLDRPSSVVDAKMGITSYTYGAFGELSSINAAGAVTTLHRDAFGRVTELDDPDRGVTKSTYDGFGQLRTSVDQTKRTYTFHYDALGRPTQRLDPDGTTTYTWDTAKNGVGQIKSIQSPQGAVQSWGYDEFGRVNSMDLTVDDQDLHAALTYETATGLPSTLTYPETGSAAPFTVKNGYDAHGNLLSVSDPTSKAPAFWTMKAADDAGRIVDEVFGNGVETTRVYDASRDRLKSIATTRGKDVYQSLAYGYDAKQNLALRSDLHDSTHPTTEAFGYDALDRITCAKTFQSGGGPGRPPIAICGTPTFAYDASGNFTSKNGDAYSYDDPSHPHAVTKAGNATFQYDALGNQVSRSDKTTIKYTSFDLPSEYDTPNGQINFEYSGTEERIRKETKDSVTLYLGGFYERVEDKSSKLVTERHYIRSGERVIAVHTRQSNSTRFGVFPPTDVAYLHTDNLGSVNVITDNTGGFAERRSYDVFGARTDKTTPKTGTIDTTLGFTGQEFDDEVGLVNMKGRIYDPKLGRFLTPDPHVSMPLSAQSWNRYSYARNNPLRYVDPSGFSVCTAETCGGSGGDESEGGDPAPTPAPDTNPSAAGAPAPISASPDSGNPNFGGGGDARDPTDDPNGVPSVVAEDAPAAPVDVTTPVAPPTDTSPNGAAPVPAEAPVFGPAAQPGINIAQGPAAQPDFASIAWSAASQSVTSSISTISWIVFPAAAPFVAVYQEIATISDPGASTTQKVIAGVGLGGTFVPMISEFGSALETADGVVAGEAGRFASLDARAVVGDALTPHHMPQAALGLTSYADGGALVMEAGEHVQTRTFGALGRATARSDAGMAFRDVLARDIRDVRQIVGPKYDAGLRQLLRYYYENFPELIKR